MLSLSKFLFHVEMSNSHTKLSIRKYKQVTNESVEISFEKRKNCKKSMFDVSVRMSMFFGQTKDPETQSHKIKTYPYIFWQPELELGLVSDEVKMINLCVTAF